jgi:DNA repair protein RecN (Recombination protein N)
MLKTLDIENIAVIEKASVEFSSGLNVLTGETGAGKSIVIDSINAILGERTSKELVRHNAEYALVSALFEDTGSDISDLLKELDIEPEEDGTLLLSRRITSLGKSVCKINGKTVTASMLRTVGSKLVNIHGQHDSQALLNPDAQYEYIDMLLENKSVLEEYKNCFKELIKVRRRMKQLVSSETDKEKELELLDYQINELEQADIKTGERDKLLNRKALITKSEDIISALNNIQNTIIGDDDNDGVQNSLNSASRKLANIKEAGNVSSLLAEVDDKLEQIKDLSSKMIDSLDFSEEELDSIDERLDLLYRFSNKYGATEEDMLDFLEDAKSRRNSILFADEELEKLNAQYDNLLDEAINKADRLSQARKNTAIKFEKKVKEELEFLDMPKLQFKVSFDKGNLSHTGYDRIEFLISTNVGEPPKPLSKIASGGELSRIMLAIKNIIAYNDTIGTLIFDEIDTGVSGKASQKIGIKLRSVAESTQVICVTHSAQIASNANKHFLIKKEFIGNGTYTSVQPLDYEGRKNELARIMGGLQITDTMLSSAEELLKQSNNS